MYIPPVREDLREKIRREVVPNVPANSWREVPERGLPLRYNIDPWTVAWSCMRFATGKPRTNAVYVLECMRTSGHQEQAAIHFEKTKPHWKNVDTAERLLYVGVTKNLIRRLDEHLNNSGRGSAQFTRVFPPIRILHVAWYPSYVRARNAEGITAELLRDRFPNDYVSQPG